MTEIWRDVPGYDGHYEVSNLGVVRRKISTSICHRKLSEAEVQQMRQLGREGRPQRFIAEQFGVSQMVVSRVFHGLAYAPPARRPLLPTRRKDGYLYVSLSVNSVVKCFAVHQLVAAAFLGPCPGRHEVNHIDGVKSNNPVTNLEYVTRSGNMLHSVDKLGHSHKLKLIDAAHIRKFASMGVKSADIAAVYGVSKVLIQKIKADKLWVR